LAPQFLACFAGVMGRAGHAFNFDSFLGTGLCRSGSRP